MNSSNRRIPDLNEGEVMLFENPDGFQGFGRIDGHTHRLILTKKQTSRRSVFAVTAHEADSATWLGDVFEAENPDARGSSGKRLPSIAGYLNTSDDASTRLRFAVWRRVSKNGVPHLFGNMRPLMPLSPPAGQTAGSHDPGHSGAALPEQHG